MKVQINNQKSFWITWKYSEVENLETSKISRITTCKIVDDSIQGSPFTVATATSKCHENDRFVKESGRKLSLARAIKALNLPKSERKIIWETYLNR